MGLRCLILGHKFEMLKKKYEISKNMYDEDIYSIEVNVESRTYTKMKCGWGGSCNSSKQKESFAIYKCKHCGQTKLIPFSNITDTFHIN